MHRKKPLKNSNNKRLHLCIIVITVVLMPLLNVACSTQAWYEGFSKSTEMDCEKMQQGAREDCLRRINHRSYDEYNKERKQ